MGHCSVAAMGDRSSIGAASKSKEMLLVVGRNRGRGLWHVADTIEGGQLIS